MQETDGDGCINIDLDPEYIDAVEANVTIAAILHS